MVRQFAPLRQQAGFSGESIQPVVPRSGPPVVRALDDVGNQVARLPRHRSRGVTVAGGEVAARYPGLDGAHRDADQFGGLGRAQGRHVGQSANPPSRVPCSNEHAETYPLEVGVRHVARLSQPSRSQRS